MRRELKNAIVQRLEFAVAELEVVGEIAERARDAALVEQLCVLTNRVRECMEACQKKDSP